MIAYLLKGVNTEAGDALGLDEFAKGGQIIGKHDSISQNLRPAGRGWASLSQPESAQRGKTYRKSLTPFFSRAFRAREAGA